MALIGLILLVKSEEINFKYFSLITGTLGLISLGVSYFIKTHYFPLLISQLFLGTFSGLF